VIRSIARADQGHLTRRRDDQQMQREETLVIETDQIKDVLGRGHHEAIEAGRSHRGAQLLTPGGELLVGKDPAHIGQGWISHTRQDCAPKKLNGSVPKAPSRARRLASPGGAL
jgi:hypothetical protein